MNEVEQVAKLSKLEIEPNNKGQVTVKLASIVDYLQQLQEADVSDIKPTTHVLPQTNVFREDALMPCLPREQALDLAPVSEEGFFKVPSIL
jgi:aspartyl-tRNA(Asn)/glutamyl-tRNA(Gln) amidotransferase subunit C